MVRYPAAKKLAAAKGEKARAVHRHRSSFLNDACLRMDASKEPSRVSEGENAYAAARCVAHKYPMNTSPRVALADVLISKRTHKGESDLESRVGKKKR